MILHMPPSMWTYLKGLDGSRHRTAPGCPVGRSSEQIASQPATRRLTLILAFATLFLIIVSL